MKETLYSIPVNDIFDTPCECPICLMKKKLDDECVEFAMGPSYMEDDIRLTTDEVGFCAHHMQMMYDFENRLGLGLIINTHMLNVIKKIEPLQKKGLKQGGLFSKKESFPLLDYLKKVNGSCFLCKRRDDIFDRYISTTFYLYDTDEAFRTKMKKCSGFCMEHYALLLEKAPMYLSSQKLSDFLSFLNTKFLDEMKRMQGEVSWFIDKFDYRNTDAPWKTSKDALPRAMNKLNSIVPNKE